MLINIGLLNDLYIFEALQAIPLLVIAGWVGYMVICRKPFNQKVKLWLWALFTFSILMASTVWCIADYNYVHYERPVYRAENLYYIKHR